MAKITVAKLFETVSEVDKRSQVALMQSEDSIQISEKTRTDLERLIATLRTDFTDTEQTQELIRKKTIPSPVHSLNFRRVLTVW